VAAGQQHDDNQIYGCFMVPVDLRRVQALEDDARAQAAQRSLRSFLHWRLVPMPTRRYKKHVA
jgi:hypothetical protein